MSTENKSKPLDQDKIRRINHLFHVSQISNRSTIAKRLGIAHRTVGKYLMSKEHWEKWKEENPPAIATEAPLTL